MFRKDTDSLITHIEEQLSILISFICTAPRRLPTVAIDEEASKAQTSATHLDVTLKAFSIDHR